MKSTRDTEDWELACFLDWKPKYHSETCDTCNGQGTVGGHFKDLDGPRQCPTCFGSGQISVAPKTPRPELPADIREHLRRAWFDFYSKEQP
jgi:hypothetical protein